MLQRTPEHEGREERRTSPPSNHTVGEIAERLSVSERSVLDWIRDGRLKAIRLSPRTIRVSDGDLEEFLDRARIEQERRSSETR